VKNKSALCFAVITLAAFAACADPLAREPELFCPEGHFLFELIDDDTAVMITGYAGGRTDVRIPPYIDDYAIRLQDAQIECCYALRIIGNRDTPETFFYLDPPYVGADQGHYDGYTQEDFYALLKRLEGVQGKFLLSSFRNKSLSDFTRRNGWHTAEVRLASPMTQGQGRSPRDKVEVLTANYPISMKDR